MGPFCMVMGKQVMSDVEFEALLARRTVLRGRHDRLCVACNEEYSTFRGERTGVPSAERDRVWAELQSVQELIDAELEAEAEAEDD